MTEVYGAGKSEKLKQIEEYIRDKLQEKLNLEDKEVESLSLYLRDKISDAMKEELSSSNVYKKWMKNIAKQLSDKNKEIRWITPIIGLEIIQEKFETKEQRISTKYNGKDNPMQIRTPTDKIDIRDQKKGIAPNFVHSLDATHLFLTILEANKEGLDSFATIHDSFGTHACDIDTLQKAIKQSFIEMYSIDILETLKNEIANKYQIDLKPIRYEGNLNDFKLQSIEKSLYFFS